MVVGDYIADAAMVKWAISFEKVTYDKRSSNSCDQHYPLSCRGCRAASQLRSSGASHGRCIDGFRFVDAPPASQSTQPKMGWTRPLHPFGRTWFYASLLFVASDRIRS